ncbi:hypothetical protein HYS47_01135 [Candidatus Woesearchaeota archaeon]|nr:hypothetical protein [Candidatus Woesearchaeota archaeon]
MASPIVISGILLFLLLVPGCLQLPPDDVQAAGNSLFVWNKVSSVPEMYRELVRHDQHYGVDFRTERLDKEVVNADIIDVVISDMDVLVRSLDSSGISAEELALKVQKDFATPQENEEDKILLLAHARKAMLESEKHWQQGYKYGDKGLVRDGFFCSEKEYITESLDHFYQAGHLGSRAQYYMDILLSSSPEENRLLLGIGSGKIKWYYSPIPDVLRNVIYERGLLEKHCSGENSSDVRVEVYDNSEESQGARKASAPVS